jgi:heme a synthase
LGIDTADAAMQRLRLLKRLSSIVIGLSLVTMFLGPLVRAESAGLACPDWPLCHGLVVPWGHGYQVFLEWIHRVAGGITALALGACVFAALRDASLRAAFGVPALLALGLMITQILLGMLTITKQLDAYVVKSHLLNAILFLSAVVYMRQTARRAIDASAIEAGAAEAPTNRLSVAASGVFLALIFIQLFLGGRVSTNYAGLVCPAFPACYVAETTGADGVTKRDPVYLPPLIGATEMHMTHRFMAYFLFALAVALVALAEITRWPAARAKLAWLLLTLILLQIFIGVVNVLNYVPVTITVLHSFVAYLIFLAAWILWLELRFDRAAR